MADFAYDHIVQEEANPTGSATPPGTAEKGKAPLRDDQVPAPSLNTELQETFKAISNSPWGARLGGLLGTVKKQGTSYLEGAQKELAHSKEDAVKGFTDLRQTIVNRTRTLSRVSSSDTPTSPSSASSIPESSSNKTSESEQIRQNEGFINRFKTEAAKRLKDVQRAEDAADEALLNFGTNIRNFLRDAVTITAPAESASGSGAGRGANDTVLFESKDAEGHRVIHTTRFDAQIHVIHSTLESFMKDPASPQYDGWKKEFQIEKKTEDIAKDLEKYTELRRAMENVVPEKVDYGTFWCRYYFLRHVIETEEQRRRELLKGAAADAEEAEFVWDDDSDSDSPATTSSTPVAAASASSKKPLAASASTTTLKAKNSKAKSSSSDSSSSESASDSDGSDESYEEKDTDTATLKASSSKEPEPRRSADMHSQPDSDASYDLVSGSTSRAPGSPMEGVKEEEDDEPDWE